MLARMKLACFLVTLAAAFVVACQTYPSQVPSAPEAYAAADVEDAISRSLPLMQASMDTWVQEQACLSCHHQGLGSMAVSLAKERGFEIDQPSLDEQARRMAQLPPELYVSVLQGDFSLNTGFTLSYLLLGRAAAGHPRNDTTDAMAYNLAGGQSDRGAWRSESHRPPLEDSPVTATAISTRALALFGPDGRSQETQERLDQARAWLEKVEPQSNEERAMKLLGLGWTGASERAMRAAANDLSSRQRPDGGWAQIATIESDAYATGQALVSLQQFGGLSVDSATYRNGVRFLLETQLEDGSWLVETRRRSPGLPYFESGFPHKLHQFISFAGTAWATMALCLTVEAGPSEVFVGPRPPRDAGDTFAADAGMQLVHSAAAFGTPDELHRVLADDPGSVDAPGPGGMTPLMFALHDEAKVELLLEADADVEARSEAQYTPLVLAGWYSGAGPALERLLTRGVAIEATGRDGMTALVRAARTGELRKVAQLLDHGADIDATQEEEGASALSYAEAAGDLELLRLLLDRGAQGDSIALNAAAFDGWTELVQELVNRDTDLNVQDDGGMTALAWAAKKDHGHGEIAAMLLAAGADPTLASSNGHTPLDWAIQFDNQLVAEQLRRALDSR
jgi:ankyrin repeat protein